MKLVKRTPFEVKTRTRCVRFRFTDDLIADGNVLKAAYVWYCAFDKNGIYNWPEWAPVLNELDVQYKCNISNLLQICSWKVENADKGVCEDLYCMISKAGGFYMYMRDVHAFKSVVANRGDIVMQPLVGASSTQCGLFTNEGFILVNPDGTYSVPIESGTVAAGAHFRHRVFVGMKNGILKYSSPGSYANFTESVEGGGSIRFSDGGGEIVAVKVFDDALYIFFQSGIIRLEVGGDPSEFRAEKVSYSGGDIAARTICVCDQAVYFLTVNGVYRLQGTRAERLPLNITFPLETSGLEGCAVWKGMPMIRYRDSSNEFKTFMIRPDGSASFIMDLVGLSQGENGKVLFLDARRYLAQLAGDGQGTVWKAGNVMTVKNNFGYSGNKCLRKICFYGEGSVGVTLISHKRSWYKMLTFEDGIAEWTLKVPGEDFTFVFDIERMTKIREVQVEFDVLTQYKEGKR